MRYLVAAAVLILLAAPVYAQEQELPPNKPEGNQQDEPVEPPVKLSAEEMAQQLQLLGSRFRSDRVEAQSTIARAGETAIPGLEEALTSQNTFLKMSAVELLGRMKRPKALRSIIEMIADSSPAVRASARRALKRYGPEALPEIERLVKSGQLDENALPDAVLAEIYRSTIVELFSQVDQGGQYPGQYALIVDLGPKAVPALLSLLDDSIGGSRNIAGGAPAVISALGDFDKDKRIIAKFEALWRTDVAAYLRQPVAISLAKQGVAKYLDEMIDARLKTAGNQTNPSTFAEIALLYHRVGKYDESQKWFRRAAEAAGPSGYIHFYNLACALAMGKNGDGAVEALKTAIENGYQNFSWMVKDKELDPIRAHAGYIELLKKHCPEHLPEQKKKDQKEEDDGSGDSGQGENSQEK